MTEEAAAIPGESRHVSVWIEVSPAAAYAYVSDPSNLPAWAAGLASGEIRQVDGAWMASSPMGEVRIEFAPTNEFGVVDHVVRTAGEVFYNPMRVIPDGGSEQRCEVTFTVRRRDGMSDEEFEADIAAVTADLGQLRKVLQSS